MIHRNKRPYSIVIIFAMLISLLVPTAAFADTTLTATLTPSSTTYSQGQAVQLTFKLNGFAAGAKLNSAEFKVAYDTAAFELATGTIVSNGTSGDVIAGTSLPASDISHSNGTITYLVASIANYTPVNDAVIFTVNMKVKDAAALGAKTFSSLASDAYDADFNSYVIPSASANVSIVELDTTAPPVPAVTSPSAALATNDSTPNITVRAEADSAITVYEGTTPVGTGTGAGETTDVSITLNTLTDGVHNLTVKAADAAANTSTAASVPAITVDTQIPDAPTVVSPASALTTKTALQSLVVRAESAATIQVYQGTTVVATGTGAGSSDVNIALGTLTDGVYNYTVKAIDTAGNESQSATVPTITVDTAAPVVTLSGVTDGASTKMDVTAAFNEGSGSYVKNNGAPQSYTSGTSLTEEGSYVLTVTDAAANATTKTFTIDKTAPTVSGVIHATYSKENVTPVFSEGTATLSIDGGTAASFTSGTIISDEGSYELIVSDSNGNTATVSFAIDKTAPAITLSGVTNGMSTKDNVTASYNEGTATYTKDGAGAVSYSSGASLSADGSYVLTVTDMAGNTANASFTIDKTAPLNVTVVTPETPSFTNDTTPIFTVKAEANSVIKIVSGTTEIGTGIGAGASTNVPITLSSLTEGTYGLSITATDAVGNTSSAVLITITIDTTAPAAPTIDSPDAETTIKSSSQSIIVKAETGSMIKVYNGSTVVGQGTGKGATGETIALSLTPGIYNLTVTTTDQAGNVSGLSTVPEITVEAAPIGFSSAPVEENVKTDANGDINLKPSVEVEKEGDKTIAKAKVDEKNLQEAIKLLDSTKPEQKVVLEVTGSKEAVKLELTGNAFTDTQKAAPNAVLSIKSELATYDLPVNAINVAALAKDLGAEAKDVKVIVTIEKVTGATTVELTKIAEDAGQKLLTEAVDFHISIEANGQKKDVSEFGTYVSRTIEINKTIDASKTTGAMYNPATGKYTFVPATFTTVDGKTQATIKRNGNSIYTVLEYNKTFADVSNHWAQADIELLASKLVLDGVSDTQFAPGNNITRAQFATMLVRALGLNEDASGVKLKDIEANAWYAGYVGAAVKAGLVTGFEDGTFKPNANITREQMASMIARALKFAGKEVNAAGTTEQKLAKFNDSGSIGTWAKASVAQAVDAGIITGMTETTFAAQENATRAQAASMLKRMLVFAEFINE